jgi:DNA gyrase subunit B
MRPVIEGGYLYLAKPPLFELIKPGRKSSTYAYSDEQLTQILNEHIAARVASGATIEAKDEAYKQAGFVEQKRYKGLGEMDAEQLFETTMNPEKRVLIQVRVNDAEKADQIFSKLMGTEVELRKNFIQTHAKFVKDLDI